ncbi:hypothetical protein GEMRC1_013313 [Eukaryota sp. GEM-RC1]
MTEPLLKIARSSDDTPTTTDVTLETVSSPCVSSLQPTEDQPDTLSDSLFLHKPSIRFQESLLILVDLHLVKRLIKSMLNKYNTKSNTHSYLDCLFDAFFKKVGYVSDCFLEFSMSAVKVFLQSSTIPLNAQHLYTFSSINSFFGADVRSVSLYIYFDEHDDERDSGFRMDTVLGFNSICTHVNCTEYALYEDDDGDDLCPFSQYFSNLHRFLDNSSICFLPHLRSFKFVASSLSNSETFTLLCNTLMTNTTLLELEIRFHQSFVESYVFTLAEVFSSNNTLKKISLSHSWNSRGIEAYLVLFNAISKNSVIESLSTGGENLSNLLALFNSPSLKKIEFSDVIFRSGQLTERPRTNLTLTELIFNSDIGGEVLAEIVNCCIGLRKLVIRSLQSHPSISHLFESLEANTRLLELELRFRGQFVDHQSRKSLTDDEVQSLSKMLENNTTILDLNLDLSVNSCQFVNITNGLKMNSTLLKTKLSVDAVDLNCLMLIFEELAVNKLNCCLNSSTHFIDVDNGFFCFLPISRSNYTISSEELSSLRFFFGVFQYQRAYS